MDYKQNTVSGESWVRTKYIAIQNERNSTPSVTFVEEQILKVGGEEFRKDLGSVIEPFTPENASEQFDLLHPETGEVIGSATYQDVYVILRSLYLHVAVKRDQANQGV